MKKTALLFIVISVFLGCSSDDNSTPNINEETLNIDEELVGKWSLTSYSEWVSAPYEYEGNEIIWEFHENGTLTVTVDEGVSVSPNMYLQTSGNSTYSTEVSGSENQYTLLSISDIPDTLSYDFVINNSLRIGHSSASDGHSYMFSFEKID